ncbi:ABC transporter permease [Fibrella aquatilis]|uniref:ABC transporter permease n=1 Tax=Fibrella aquatilis TaxID=2817059 RepID=A0A939JXA9_9BACT|nr:ABC transporter permease [Fibrella aquatilis]MBO0930849.1 ABC transporter permease [Fibrella aquatilis]
MFRNYVKIAWRSLVNNRLFSLINIVGLAGGLAVCLLNIAHIRSVFQTDSFQLKGDRIVRILTDVTDLNGNKQVWAASPIPLAEQLQRDYPFVESTARVIRTYGNLNANKHKFDDVAVYAVDSSFFSIFSFPLAQGHPATQPGTAVLTHETAVRFFGKTSPLGKVIQQEGTSPTVVTGVLAKFPNASHLRFDVLVSTGSVKPTPSWQDWRTYSEGNTYVLLRSGVPVEKLAGVLPSVVKRATQGMQLRSEKGYSLRAQPLMSISPARENVVGMARGVPMWVLLVEMGIGLIALLMAAFNYINLTLARSLSRAREVGVRKAAGATRGQVVGQFMAESALLALLSAGLAFGLFGLMENMAFVQRWLEGGVRWDATLVGSFLGFSLAAGLLAGFFPGRILSGFQAAEVLRSHSGLRLIRGLSLRKILIVTQFSIALVAMIALLSTRRQMSFMITGDYGFRRDRILNVPLNDIPFDRYANELANLPGIEHVAATSGLFGDFGSAIAFLKRSRSSTDSIMADTYAVHPELAPAMSLSLLAGRELPPLTGQQTGNQVLINEEAVRTLKLGSPGTAVGQALWLTDSTEVRVAGVLKDFRYLPFTFTIRPLVLRPQPSGFRFVSIAVAPGQEQAVLAGVTRLWHRLHPYDPFDGQWQDDFLKNRQGSAADDIQFLGLLVVLAFLISCLGLLGIVTYTTQTRTKEIGVRKVLGAEVGQLVWLLARGFAGLLLIASVIALPLGYLAGTAILSNFAYHTTVGIGTMLACVGTLLALGALSIGFQTYRAAQMDPVKSLRSE